MNDSNMIDLVKVRKYLNELALKRGELFRMKKKMMIEQGKLPTDRPLTDAEIDMVRDEIDKDLANYEKSTKGD